MYELMILLLQACGIVILLNIIIVVWAVIMAGIDTRKAKARKDTGPVRFIDLDQLWEETLDDLGGPPDYDGCGHW